MLWSWASSIIIGRSRHLLELLVSSRVELLLAYLIAALRQSLIAPRSPQSAGRIAQPVALDHATQLFLGITDYLLDSIVYLRTI